MGVLQKTEFRFINISLGSTYKEKVIDDIKYLSLQLLPDFLHGKKIEWDVSYIDFFIKHKIMK